MNPINSRFRPIVLTDEDLLELYLSLPTVLRNERFANTARTAEITGLSVRTIQFWIETGAIRGIAVGRKRWIDLDSLRNYLKVRMQEQLGR